MKRFVFISQGLNNAEASGIQRNTLELLKCLDGIVSSKEADLLIPVWETDNYTFQNINVVKCGKQYNKFGKLGKKIANYLYKNYYTWRYIKQKNSLSIDLLLMVPLYGCDIEMIYDCIPELFPSHYNTKIRKRARKKRLRHQKRALHRARLVLTDSESAKRDIIRFYKIDEGIIKVIPCGWQHFIKIEEDGAILKKLGLLPNQYFFSLGSRLPHKNAKWLSYAAKTNPHYKFVVSGSSPKNQVYDFEGESLPNMIFAGRLSDGEVKTLMRYCKAFIQPSLYEGFGIPPMEAMSVGADCIVSNVASLPEVYKKSVWYIDPYDYDKIDLNEIMSRPKESNKIILEEYSWEKSAKKLYAILKQLANEKSG